MYDHTQIEEVHLEITQRCNAACPMCDRNENGGAVNQHIRNDEQEQRRKSIITFIIKTRMKKVHNLKKNPTEITVPIKNEQTKIGQIEL